MNFSENQIKLLNEVIELGVKKAGQMLNEMINSSIKLDAPKLDVVDVQIIKTIDEDKDSNTSTIIRLDFFDSIEGTSLLVFPLESAMKFVSGLTGEDSNSDSFDALVEEAMTEIGNIVLNNVMGSITNAIKCQVEYKVPVFKIENFRKVLEAEIQNFNTSVLKAETKFFIEEIQVQGEIFVFLNIEASVEALFLELSK